MGWTIKNKDGNILKYLYKEHALFNQNKDRAFRALVSAKRETVERTLKKLIEWGHEGCEIIQISDNEHEKYNIVEKRKNQEQDKENKKFQELIDNNDDEFFKEYIPQCRICSRSCKQRMIATIWGRCPQLDVRVA